MGCRTGKQVKHLTAGVTLVVTCWVHLGAPVQVTLPQFSALSWHCPCWKMQVNKAEHHTVVWLWPIAEDLELQEPLR